jgi:hypothetical protein
MKKITLGLVLLGAMVLPVVAMAQPAVTIGSLQEVITKLENALWIIFGGVAVICFVIAGILFLTAAGNPEKVQQARNAFLWGVAGVVVGIVAYSIIAIVSSVIG